MIFYLENVNQCNDLNRFFYKKQSLQELGGIKQMVEKEIKEKNVLSLVGAGKMTIRHGAKLLGMDYWTFRKLMEEHEIPTVTGYTVDELEKDLKTLHRLMPREKTDDSRR